MDSTLLYRILLDQREELDSIIEPYYVKRTESAQFDFKSYQAQVVIGVRRSGKSTMCHMALKENDIEYGYINFDDDRLANVKTEDLNDVLETLYRIYGTNVRYLFFDEIQNVEGWHLFVNRLLRMKIHVIITGSNAKLLSSELSTHLTGRYNDIRLYPFSFREYCEAKSIPIALPTTKNIALQQEALLDYLREGGFPELDGISNRHNYVEGIINAIITKDIRFRFRLRNSEGLKRLAHHLISNVAQIINVKNISEEMGIGTEKTVRKYIDYLQQAFLILPLKKFSYKSRERLTSEKAYLIDTGIITYNHNVLSSENLGWRLENVVRMELLRRTNPFSQDLYYYRPSARQREVDFVVTERDVVKSLIQVSLDISNPQTLKRELTALKEASDKLRCDNLTLIALSQTRQEEFQGKTIHIVNASEWLLLGSVHPQI